MPSITSPLDQFLLFAKVLTENTSDPVVKPALAVYGYTDEILAYGKTLYLEVMELQAAQNKEYAEQIAATTGLNDIWAKADEQYMKTLKIARVAFQDIDIADRAALLYGRRKESLSGWLLQTHNFYTNILNTESLIAALSKFGFTEAKLREDFALVQQVADQSAKQQKEISEAQAATRRRDQKIDELAKWVSDLRAVPKVALAHDPEQLEKLGILVRSSPASRSQKAAESGQSA